MNYTERSFPIADYQLSAKEWHAEANHKVIACHGWLDNAASFDVLAPLLSDCHIVAMDLPGHGKSDHKSPQATYNIWDDLLDILAVADAMDWQTFSLLGHSRGGFISMLLSSVMPERIDSLVLLDGILPVPEQAKDAAHQLRAFIKQRRTIGSKKTPIYGSEDDAVMARCSASGMSESSARLITARGLEQIDDRFRWTSDPRLTIASSFKLTEEHNDSFVKALAIPNLIFIAEQGLAGKNGYVSFAENYTHLNYKFLPGDHYFHMNEQASLIAEHIREFYATL